MGAGGGGGAAAVALGPGWGGGAFELEKVSEEHGWIGLTPRGGGGGAAAAPPFKVVQHTNIPGP